jgi:hypothetical protein
MATGSRWQPSLVLWGGMSAYSSPQPSRHRVGVLMSPVGRFLGCRDCLLTFCFPHGEQYDEVAKQFKSHLCGSPHRIPNGKFPTS